MKEETSLKLSIITLVYLLIVLMVIVPPCETQDIIVIESGLGPTIITVDHEYFEVHEILLNNDFNDWEPEEQRVLTQMMQLTSNEVGFDDEFIDYINSMNRSEDIFNTYIDLLEHAGY